MGCAAARCALGFRPNHDHEHADSINGSAITPQPLSTVDLKGECVGLSGGRDGFRCEDSGAVLENAAVEVRGVTLLKEVIPVDMQHGNSDPD